MRALILATLAVFALALPAGASRSDVDVIDAALQAAVDARTAGDGYDAARDAVYDIVTDPATLPRCREYADIAYVALLVIDAGEAAPQSEMLQYVFGWALEAAPVARNNCLLAV